MALSKPLTMTVARLIAHLQTLPADAIIQATYEGVHNYIIEADVTLNKKTNTVIIDAEYETYLTE